MTEESREQNSHPPLVSIIVSAYNAQDTLAAALVSLLQQDYPHVEIILINDGSTDKTSEICRAYAQKDERIKLIEQENIGLTRALNRGINAAQGLYIARQDADDTSYPQRIVEQVNFMETHPDVILCGSNCENVYRNGQTALWGWRDEKTLNRYLTLKTPFAHSTAFFRAHQAKQLAGYDTSLKTAQDMDFWIRLSQLGRVVMLPQPLVQRHILQNSVSLKKRWRQFYDALCIRWKYNGNKAAVIYHSLRSVIILLMPEMMIATWQKIKNK